MGYAVKTAQGVDLYENAVSIKNVGGYLHVSDKETEVLAIYYPGIWQCASVSSSRTLPTTEQQPSVPPEVISLLNEWLTSDESKEASQYPYEVISEFILANTK